MPFEEVKALREKMKEKAERLLEDIEPIRSLVRIFGGITVTQGSDGRLEIVTRQDTKEKANG